MSYLIALYVYYYGNNLVAFGIVKGLQDADIKNQGTKRPEEIDPTLVDPELIKSVQKQEALSKQKSFEDIMRQAIKDSQKNSYNLYQKGMSVSNVFANTPDAIIDEYGEDGSIDLNFFNELNGF